jgi:hypothetical protein
MITSKTAKNLILDAGVVYINYGKADERILGATQGGSSFVVEREIKEIEVDGAKGKIKGLRRLITENATLTVNMREMSTANIKLALAGSSSTNVLGSDGLTKTHDSIKSNGELTDADFLANVAVVAKVSGSKEKVIVILENALADGEFNLSFEDKEEATTEVQFSAHYDPADLSKVPYEIRYPVVA